MPTQHFEQLEAYILKRHPYRENHYLLDLFTEEHGRFRAVARLQTRKNYRMTNSWSPFHGLKISGQRKKELATIWDSFIFIPSQLSPSLLMSACYANELILTHLPADFPDRHLYRTYRQTIADPNAPALRRLENNLLTRLYQIPGIISEAAYYRIHHSEYGLAFIPSTSSGYPAELIHPFIEGKDTSHHLLCKSLQQTLLRLYQHDTANTRDTLSALHKLLQK